jgi:hypothetical protein
MKRSAEAERLGCAGQRQTSALRRHQPPGRMQRGRICNPRESAAYVAAYYLTSR